jgi:shikimate dehydrogenase
MKHYALIGHPLTHSFSKTYFLEKFEKHTIDADYINIEIEQLTSTSFVKEHALSGFNVTIPHKENILSFLDELDDEAKAVGAVNTVSVLPNSKLKGYNTDVFGFRQSIKPFLESHHERALILGTGGSSKAISHVLKHLGIDVLYASRHPKNSNEIAYTDINDYVLKAHLLIINCSPIGTYPNVKEFPNIPYAHITNKHLLYDLVYNPSETLFLEKGKLQGAKTLNGLSMLHLQAEKAWEIWNS